MDITMVREGPTHPSGMRGFVYRPEVEPDPEDPYTCLFLTNAQHDELGAPERITLTIEAAP